MDLLEDFQCLETIPGDDDLVSFFRQNCGGELRNFRFIVDDQDQFARALGFRIGISGVIRGSRFGRPVSAARSDEDAVR